LCGGLVTWMEMPDVSQQADKSNQVFQPGFGKRQGKFGQDLKLTQHLNSQIVSPCRFVIEANQAKWIRKQFESKVPMLDCQILDFYHLSEHIWQASNACYAQGSDQAKLFVSELLHIAKHVGPTGLLTRLTDEHKRWRSKSKRKALKDLLRYIARRFEMCDYPRFIENGWQIVSGPTEAMCKLLTYRLKGPGMRWDRRGSQAIMALVALLESNTWKSYWNLQKRAA